MLILTLVLMNLPRTAFAVSKAAGSTPLAPPSAPSPQQIKAPPNAIKGNTEVDTTVDEQNLMLSPPPTPHVVPPRARYYPYRQSLGFHLGAFSSNDGAHPWTWLIGINYLWPRFLSPQVELGADVVANFGGHLNFVIRHILRQRNYVRPYYSWGITHEVTASEGLASFSNYKNYYLRLAIGAEIVRKLPRSARFELGGIAGAKKYGSYFTFGWAWGWSSE